MCVWAVVSDAPRGTPLPVAVPRDKTYWGLASVGGINLQKHESEPPRRGSGEGQAGFRVQHAGVEGR